MLKKSDSKNTAKMEKIIMPVMCEMFEQYSEIIVREYTNLSFGDGECPKFNYIIQSNMECPSDCKFYKEKK